MGKIISIDEINRAAMEGREDVLVDLCRVFDHEECVLLCPAAKAPP